MDSTNTTANSPSSLTNSSRPSRPSTKKPRHRKQAEDPKTAAAPAADNSSQDPPHPQQQQPLPTRPPVQLPLQPYPGPPSYHIMNPAYPMNSPPPPFPQQHQQGYPPHQPNGASGPGMPGPLPQYYPMHPSPYPPPHTFPYPHYQQMLMYGAPRTTEVTHAFPPQQPVPATPGPIDPSSGAGTSVKRKRKAGLSQAGATDDEVGPSSAVDSQASQVVTPQTPHPGSSSADIKKRTKTQRACDSCRSRKIRCDILPEAEPPVCQHCKQYGFECTFFLPITETRFKKKKLEDDPSDKEAKRDPLSPHADPQSKGGDPRVFGPTSAAHLLHSEASFPSRIYESWDSRHHYTWEVSKTGDGLLRVERPTAEESGSPATTAAAVATVGGLRQSDLRLDRDMIEKLLNTYFSEVASIYPVVTQAEFLAAPSLPSPLLLHSMCLVAAGRREFPQTVFDVLRTAVNSMIKVDDIMSVSSITNVQSLLILCMMGDTHSVYVPTALSAIWIRVGACIRMAQDIGLHRAEASKQNIELRRRLWCACVIADRWTSLAFGHPYMIDVQDCDARLPSSGEIHDLYTDELVRLSIILGRVLKAIYSPSGLSNTTDDMLQTLHADLEAWKKNLPESLQFKGPESPGNAGLLHMLYSTVCMIFWRVFMRISYTCPEHLNFAMEPEDWQQLVQLTGESIEWLDANEQAYDVWFVVAYCATSCALVQYHTWARRMEGDSINKLRKLRDCVRRWESSYPPDHMSTRRKTAEIISLLYEATQGPTPSFEAPALNPTGGVTATQPGATAVATCAATFGQEVAGPASSGQGMYRDGHTPAEMEGPGVQPPSQPHPSVSLDRGQNQGPTEAAKAVTAEEAEAEDCEVVATTVMIPSSPPGAVSVERAGVLLSPSPFAPPLPAATMLEDVRTREGAEAGVSDPLLSPGGSVGGGGAPAAGEAAGARPSPAPMVTITPLAGGVGGFVNVNPAIDARQGQTTITTTNNAMDEPRIEGLAQTDFGLLEGIPGRMFDWGQWDAFFARINNSTMYAGNGNVGAQLMHQPQLEGNGAGGGGFGGVSQAVQQQQHA